MPNIGKNGKSRNTFRRCGAVVSLMAMIISVAMSATEAWATGVAATVVGRGEIGTILTAHANGTGAIAIGDYIGTSADGYFATAIMGYASGAYAVSIGYAASAPGEDSIAIGRQTSTSGNYNVAVGSGAYAGECASAFGENSAASGQFSTAVGIYAKALAKRAISMGVESSASGASSIAIGDKANASSAAAIAMGINSGATATNGVAIGQGSSVTGSNSVALGANSVASGEDEVSVGNSSATRKITNVTDGSIESGSHDVVTGGQLNTTNANVATNAENISALQTKATTYDTYITSGGLNANSKAISNVAAQTLAENGTYAATTGQLYTEQQARIAAVKAINDSAVMNSGITSAKVGSYDTHVANTDIHVTTADKTKWNGYETSFSTGTLATTGDAQIGGNMSVTGTSTFTGTATFSQGASMGGQKITNVASGVADTDAVNVGQMNTALGNKADKATSLAGYDITDAYTKTQVNTALSSKADTTYVDTKTTAAENNAKSYTDTQISAEATARDSAISTAVSGKADTSYVNAATAVIVNSGSNINTGSGIVLKQGSNIEITNSGNEVTITSLGGTDADAVHYEKSGSTKTNNIVLEGLNSGDKVTIKNLAAGTADTDAVNVGQLKTTNENVATNAANISTLQTKANTYDTYITSGGLNANSKAISNVATQTLAENGTYAATTGQLYTEQQARISEDNTLQTNIENEEAARLSGDSTLSTSIGTVAEDKNYIKSANSVSDNLVILDTQAKTNADAIANIIDGTTVVGNATNATNDGAGNNIASTYATKSEFTTHTGDTTAHITAVERAKWNDYETSFSTGSVTTTGDAQFGGNMSVAGTSTFTGFATFNAGASMGGQKITNVASGTADTDAVNVGQLNTALSGKADSSTTYTKTEVDNAMATKANSTDVYTKTDANNKFVEKATTLEGYGITDAYTKTEVDTVLSGKADTTYVDGKATEAENNAKSYTDTQINTEVTNRNTAIANAVAAEATARDTAISTAVAAEATARDTAISNAVATKADASNVYTKTETDSTFARMSALDCKADVSATAVKINSGDNINAGSGVVLKQGSNIEITNNGNEITITSLGGSDAQAVHYDTATKEQITLEGADGTTIKNVAAGTADTDAVNVGQMSTALSSKADKSYVDDKASSTLSGAKDYTDTKVKGTYTDATYADSKLTLTKVDGTKTELTIDSGGGAIAGGDKPEGAKDAKATGEGAVASGYNSFAEGVESVATGYNTAVSKKSSSGIAIGNGTTVGYSDGKITGEDTAAENSIGIGYNTTVTGSNSVAVGTGHIVTGNNSGAFGDPSYINADNSYAIGNNNCISSSAEGSFIMGNNSKVTGKDTFVIGSNVTTAANNAVVLGNNSTATRDNTVSVGASGAERQITNVAAGTVGTDAANMNQLWGVEKESREIAAMSGALAGLHYMEPSGEGDDRVSGAVAYGGYRGQSAAAVGLAYKPSPNVMVSASTSIGNSQNIYNAGVSVKFGKGKTVNRAEMAKQIKYLNDKLEQESREKADLKAENARQDAKIEEQGAKIEQLLKMVNALQKKKEKPVAAKKRAGKK